MQQKETDTPGAIPAIIRNIGFKGLKYSDDAEKAIRDFFRVTEPTEGCRTRKFI